MCHMKCSTIFSSEYCFKETFQPSCPSGEVLVITSAMYGRMKLGKCVTMDHGYLGCSSDELVTLDRICSGRESCSIDVVDIPDHMTTPLTCIHDLNAYLEAGHKCLQGSIMYSFLTSKHKSHTIFSNTNRPNLILYYDSRSLISQ